MGKINNVSKVYREDKITVIQNSDEILLNEAIDTLSKIILNEFKKLTNKQIEILKKEGSNLKDIYKDKINLYNKKYNKPSKIL